MNIMIIMNLEQADDKLSNMSHDSIVKSWLYHYNRHHELKAAIEGLQPNNESQDEIINELNKVL